VTYLIGDKQPTGPAHTLGEDQEARSLEDGPRFGCYRTKVAALLSPLQIRREGKSGVSR
jgi:hypothetical protein